MANSFTKTVGGAISVIYYLIVMFPILVLLLLMPLMLLSDIKTIMDSGFSIPNNGPTAVLAWIGFWTGLSLLIPVFRKMYHKLPWMFAFVKVLYIDLVILTIAILVLNYGYGVQSHTRHTIFLILMVVQIVIFRILMCVYFSKQKVSYIGSVDNE